MILYHGSNVWIDAIDLTKSKPGKDFGIGFYLSADLNQAKDMAEKKALIFGGNPRRGKIETDGDAAVPQPSADGRVCVGYRTGHHQNPTAHTALR